MSRGSLSTEVSDQGMTISAAELLTAASIDKSGKFPFDNNRDICYFCCFPDTHKVKVMSFM